MPRRNNSTAEDVTKLVGGIILLMALTGGAKGFPERLGAIVSGLFFLIVSVAVLGIGVGLTIWWVRRARRNNEAEFTLEGTRSIAPLPEGREMAALSDPKPSAEFRADTRVENRTGSTERWVVKLRALDWFQFEKLIGEIYRRQGYGVERKGGAKADGGVDLVVEKEGARRAVQCKHWRGQDVGVRQIREFLGALTDAGLKDGVLVTINGFTNDARTLAQRHGIELLTEEDLLGILERLDVAYDREFRELLTNPEKRCPKCEAPMKLRVAGKGWNAGRQFWGCSRFPRCRFILQAEGSIVE